MLPSFTTGGNFLWTRFSAGAGNNPDVIFRVGEFSRVEFSGENSSGGFYAGGSIFSGINIAPGLTLHCGIVVYTTLGQNMEGRDRKRAPTGVYHFKLSGWFSQKSSTKWTTNNSKI